MDRRKALKKVGVLAGATISMPSLFSLLQSCKDEERSQWQPIFLNEDETKTISTLVDTILPTTDTPGALDVNVDVFIDRVIAKTYDRAGQDYIRNEIAAFNERSEKGFGAYFFNLSEADKKNFLEQEEASSGKFSPGVWGTAVGPQERIGFYRSMKSMTVWAYCTSEEIGKNVLSYDPIPGTYKPCIPLAEVGNKWSL